ncbi:hypothetical protein [Flavobacterium sp.]
MKKHYPVTIGLSTYAVALIIMIHWALISSFDEFINLYKDGFSRQTINTLPSFLKPIYKGTPNLITLITFILFTFSAFFLIQEKRRTYFYISMSSFFMIAYLFIFLVSA